MKLFNKKRIEFFEIRKIKEEPTEEELISEEDLMWLVVCGVFALLEGAQEWFNSVGCSIDVLRVEGLLEEYRFALWYESEILKHADISLFFFGGFVPDISTTTKPPIKVLHYPQKVLPYAQKVFEQWCQGKATHGLLEYLNNPDLTKDLRETGDFSEAAAYMESFSKKQNNFCERGENKETFTEEDLMRLIVSGVFGVLQGGHFGLKLYTSAWHAIDVFREKGLLEQWRFARWCRSEIAKHVTYGRTRFVLNGFY